MQVEMMKSEGTWPRGPDAAGGQQVIVDSLSSTLLIRWLERQATGDFNARVFVVFFALWARKRGGSANANKKPKQPQWPDRFCPATVSEAREGLNSIWIAYSPRTGALTDAGGLALADWHWQRSSNAPSADAPTTNTENISKNTIRPSLSPQMITENWVSINNTSLATSQQKNHVFSFFHFNLIIKYLEITRHKFITSYPHNENS